MNLALSQRKRVKLRYVASLDDDDPVNSMMTGRIAATVLYAARQWTADQWNRAMQAAVAFAEHGSVAKGEVV